MRPGAAASRGRGIGVLLAFSVVACAVVWAPAATASTFTWSGKASSSSPGWSNTGNWMGGTAPSPSSTVSLSFPLLGSQCAAAKPAETCYLSEDDVSGLTAESIDVTDGGEYEIEGSNAITLGSGGLTSQPEGTATGYATIGLPLTLGETQTWHLAGSSRASLANHLFLLEGAIGGESSELTVDTEDSVEFAVGAQVDVGAVKIDGAETTGNRDANAIVGLGGGGSLNAGDSNLVRLSHVYFFGSGGIGALSTEAATLAIGSGGAEPGRLEAASANLDSETTAAFEAHGTGDEAGADYSQLASSGSVSLGSASLAMVVAKPEGEACSALPVGQTYTLVSTTGALTGSFGNAPEGGEIPVTYVSACGSMPAQKLVVAYSRSGTTKTVTATVAGSVSSTTSLAASPGDPVTDQTVTLTAIVSADGGFEPAGTVSFEDQSSPVPGCSSQPVVRNGSAYTATCQASFLAPSSPESLTAIYVPTSGNHVLGSSSSPLALDVRSAPTVTTLSASTSAPAVGQQVVYTATVTQSIAPTLSGPAGGVVFSDGQERIGSCASRPLTVGIGSSTATCTFTYEYIGEHAIKAEYLPSNDNFSTSSSGTISVTVGQAIASEHGSEGQAGGKASSLHLKLLGHRLKLKGDVVTANLRCEGSGQCDGTVELLGQVAVRAHGKRRMHTVVIGSGHYSISAGHKSTIRIELDNAGRAAVKQARGELAATMTTKSPATMLGKVNIEN
jgi:hypothetical protein